MKGVMRWAEEMGYVERSPIAAMKKPPRLAREEFIPFSDWPRLLSYATDEAFRDLLAFLLPTGCRPQEVKRFEAKHLDRDGRRLIFAKPESKGKKRNRVVYLPDDAFAIVDRLAKQYAAGPLFRTRKGQPWDRNAIRMRFRRLKRLMNMPKLCCTTLRHSWTHHQLTSGVDSLTVAKLAGHVDTRMVATRYGHLEAANEFLLKAVNATSLPDLQSMPTSPSA